MTKPTLFPVGLKHFHFLSKVGKNRFQRIFLPSDSLDMVSSSDMLFCFEVLSKELAKERVVLLRVQQVIKLQYLVILSSSWPGRIKQIFKKL